MLNLSEYHKVLLKGKGMYSCLISPSGLIVRTVPHNPYLVDRNIQDIYREHSKDITIENIQGSKPPIILDSDKFNLLKGRNPSLRYLYEKFDCEFI